MELNKSAASKGFTSQDDLVEELLEIILKLTLGLRLCLCAKKGLFWLLLLFLLLSVSFLICVLVVLPVAASRRHARTINAGGLGVIE